MTTKNGSNGTKPDNAWGTDYGSTNGNAPEGERPEPFTSAGQSPGEDEPESTTWTTVIAAVLACGYDRSALLDVPTVARNPASVIAAALIEFNDEYNRIPKLDDEFWTIKDKVVEATPGDSLLGKDSNVARRGVARRFDVIAEIAERLKLNDDPRPTLDALTAFRRRETIRRVIRDADEAFERGDVDGAIEAMTKAQPITSTSETWTTYTADELEAAVIPVRGFVVEMMMPQRGVQWRGGAPKRGKSLYTLYECLAITSGRDTVAGRFKILERPKILYVAREDADFRVQDRQRDILAAWGMLPPGDRLRYLIQQKMDLLNPSDVARLRDLCVREGRTVLVLDTWTALSPGADPMEAETQAKLAAAVVQLAIDIGGLVIVVDHTRKNRPDGMPLTAAEILGPSQKWQSADHIVMLDRKPQSSRYEFYVEGRDLDEEQRFILERSPRGSKAEKFLYVGTVEGMVSAQVETGDNNRQRVLQVMINATRPVTTTEVLTAVNAQPGQEPLALSTVRGHLSVLVDGGWLVRDGKGPATTYAPARESADPTSQRIAGGSENPQ
jgi:AAA domain-containing protein